MGERGIGRRRGEGGKMEVGKGVHNIVNYYYYFLIINSIQKV